MEKKEKDELVKKYGFSEDLMEKIEHSIDVMRKAEGLALEFYDKGFYLCFSGGKDSQCLYHLAILAGVKFEANMNMTSVDPPQVVRFVKNHYQNIVRHAPEINFYQLIIKKKSLPFSTKRFCCDILKERGGANTVSLVGIRAEESKKRAGRNELEITRRKLSVSFDQFDEHKEKMVTCVGGKDKIIISPILSWTSTDVWEFLNKLGVPHCELYDQGQERIGCLFCPMSRVGEMRSYAEKYPHQTKKLRDAIAELCKMGKYQKLGCDPDLVLEWYLSKRTTDNFLKWKEKQKAKQQKFNL